MGKLYILIISVIICNSHDIGVNSQNNSGRNFIYNKYEYDTLINVTVNDTTEQILEFYEDSDKWRGFPTRVHVSSNNTIDGDYPLFITATQQKGVSSWELPLVVQTSKTAMVFDDMARTLCPHDAGTNITSETRPLIQLTTSNPKNVSVNIKLRRVQNFYLQVNQVVSFSVTPSTPKYYYFSFDSNPWNYTREKAGFLPRFNYTIPKSVILIIESDDNVCAVVSVQNNSCPVFDNEKDMLYQGYHLTMTTLGGITLTQSMFPVGFYVVFMVKQSDEECTGVSRTEQGLTLDQWTVEGMGDDGRVKNFRFRIIATISYKEYVWGALALLGAIALVAAFALLLYLPLCARSYEPVAVEVEEAPIPSASHVNTAFEDTLEIKHDALEASETELAADAAAPLTLAGLSRARPQKHATRSNRYFWSSLTVALVYALPVVQLLATYQQMVFQTGNQDLCYYNFLCAHPLGQLSDFNHVLSNAGYVLLGLVFMLQTRARQLADRARPEGRGIPQHAGLFYSMGLALAMEGILSACYHLCPNKMNFQFDSSFMYVIAVLCMVKLYQNRHPDVNASAHATFLLLAFIMAIGLIGIMYPSIFFWVAFTILHLATCFVLTLKIYYVGKFKLEWTLPSHAWAALRRHGRMAFVPNYVARAVLLAIANAANWALAAYGLYEHNKDFARHLLAVLLGNTLLYTLFYSAMKLLHRERLPPRAAVYLVLAHCAWFGALRLFLASKTKWSQTPAMSRRHNAECTAMQFYDTHDLWHLASAAALFFSFNMLLTIDDALRDTPRELIPVF